MVLAFNLGAFFIFFPDEIKLNPVMLTKKDGSSLYALRELATDKWRKKEYGDELNDYFKMTYDGMDFVSFHVQSFIFPPEKTNEDKFFEVFGMTEK